MGARRCSFCTAPTCKHQQVVLAYVHFDNVAAITMNSVESMLRYDALGDNLIGPVFKCHASSLGVIESVNKIAKAFVESDREWIFWIDCDMGFAANTVERLVFAALQQDLSAVSALTFKYQQTEVDGLGGYLCEDRPVIMHYGEAKNGDRGFMCRQNYPENTAFQTQATGMACVLIHRRVYEQIQQHFSPGGKFYPGDETLGRMLWGKNGGWHAPFPAPPDSAFDTFGPDVSFWSRAAMCDPSFMPYVHTGILTDHQKTTWRSHHSYVQQVGDGWRLDAVPDGMSEKEDGPNMDAVSEMAEVRPSPVQNRKQRRAAAKAKRSESWNSFEDKESEVAAKVAGYVPVTKKVLDDADADAAAFQMDVPGIGGVPLPPPDLDTAG